MTTKAARAPSAPSPARSPKPSWSRGLTWALYALAAMLAARLLTGTRSGPPVGGPAQDFSLSLVGEAGRFSLAAERGHPVLIDVMASWCGPCRASAPMLADASRAARKKDVRFVAVSMDGSPADAERARDSWHIPYPVALDDGQFSRAYQIKVLPTIVVIDEQGRVAHVSSGEPRAAQIEAWLAEVGAARR